MRISQRAKDILMREIKAGKSAEQAVATARREIEMHPENPFEDLLNGNIPKG